MNESLLRSLAREAMATSSIDPYLDVLYNLYPGCDYYRFAYLLAEEMQPSLIVELGTQYGRCTAHFAAGARNATVYTLDRADCQKNEIFERYTNIVAAQSDSVHALLLAGFKLGSIGICFADTLHQTDWVLAEVAAWTPKMGPGSVWLFDDLREMPDLIRRLPFRTKGTLVGLHTTPVEVPENVVDVGFGYAIVE